MGRFTDPKGASGIKSPAVSGAVFQSHPPVIKHGNGKWTIEIGDFRIKTKTSIYRGFSIAMFDYQRVFFAFLMHPMNMRHIAGRDRAAECAARRQSLHKLLCKLLHRLMLILAVALDCSSVLFLFSSGPEWHSSSLE